jgi:pimeloyl-ACP methyl ester carboxylesterase
VLTSLLHRYWDSELHPEKYSYVDAALKAGYSVLSYDRIGTGMSDKPDAYEIVGADTHVEVARGLIELARQGRLADPSKDPVGQQASTKFEKIVAVGHSIGSAFTLGLVIKHGDLVDAAIPTGFIPNSEAPALAFATMGVEFAPLNNPQKYGDLTSGYIVQGTKYNAQQFFLKLGNFEAEMGDYAYSITDAVAIQDALSPGTALSGPAMKFKGPLLVSSYPRRQYLRASSGC